MARKRIILSGILILGIFLRVFPFQGLNRGNLSYNECLVMAGASQPVKDILGQYFNLDFFNTIKTNLSDYIRKILKNASYKNCSQWIRVKSEIPDIKEAQISFSSFLYDNSIYILNEYLKKNSISDSSLILAYLGLGSSYIEKGITSVDCRLRAYQEAKACLLKAKKLSKKDDLLGISVCSGLGFLYLQEENYEKAIEILNEGLSYSLAGFEKEKLDMYTNLGYTYLKSGQKDKAKEFFKKALSLSSSKKEKEYIESWPMSLRPLSFVAISPEQAPLRYLILHFFMLLGSNEFIVRLPSLIFGIAGIIGIYFLGNALFGASTGFLSSFLLASSMWHIRHSVSASNYALYVFLSLLGVYFFYRSIKSDSLFPKVMFVGASVLGLYSFCLLGSVLLAEFLFIFAFSSFKKENKNLISWGILFLIIAALFLPMLIRGFPGIYRNGFAWKKGFGDYRWGITAKDFFPALCSIFNGVKFKLPVNLLILIMGFISAIYYNKKKEEALLLVLLIGIPIILLSVCFIVNINMAERYFFIAYPFFIILCSYGIVSIRNKFIALFLILIFDLALILYFISPFIFTVDKYIPQDYLRHDADFQSCVRYLQENYRENDAVIMVNASGIYALKYNLNKNDSPKVEITPTDSLGCRQLKYDSGFIRNVFGLRVNCKLEESIMLILNKFPRVWLIDLDMIQYVDFNSKIRQWLIKSSDIKQRFCGMTIYLLKNDHNSRL